MYSGNSGQPPFQGNPAGSPPLHHPIPQHPIPPFRSPPPDQQQRSFGSQNQGYAPSQNIYAPATGNQAQAQGGQGGQGTFGTYGNFLNDPSAQIGIEVGRNALNYGQEYLGKNVSMIWTVINQNTSYANF